jgi:hypothetical protein
MYPIDGAAIITYIVLIMILTITFFINKRLRQNLAPIVLLSCVFLYALFFVPWQFWGAPISSSILAVSGQTTPVELGRMYTAHLAKTTG